jgi:hypothetical protein
VTYRRTVNGASFDEILHNLGAYDVDPMPDAKEVLYPMGDDPEGPGVPQNAHRFLYGAERGGPPRIANVVRGRYGMGDQMVGDPRPPQHLFRAVSEDDWQQVVRRGYMKSDGRMNLSPDEGTVAAVGNPSIYLPGNLHSQQGRTHVGRIARIDYTDDDGWYSDHDNYAKTQERIPLERISAVTEPLTQGQNPRRRYPGNILQGMPYLLGDDPRASHSWNPDAHFSWSR